MQNRHIPRAIRWFAFVVRPLLMVLTKRDWQGAEHLPTDGGYVLAPNHLSHLDPVLFGHFQFDHGIAPRYLAKDALFEVPGLGRLMRAARQVPVYRTSPGAAAESVRAACEAVAAGEAITVYPEGTITRDPDLWPMTGRTGAVRVALTTGRPLVPVLQWGPQDILWPYSKRPRIFPRTTYRVRVGPSIDLSDLAGRPVTDDVLATATDRLMNTLTDMMSELRGRTPTAPRLDVRTLRARHTDDGREG